MEWEKKSKKELRAMTEKERDVYFERMERAYLEGAKKKFERDLQRAQASAAQIRSADNNCKYLLMGYMIANWSDSVLMAMEELAREVELTPTQVEGMTRLWRTVCFKDGGQMRAVPQWLVKRRGKGAQDKENGAAKPAAPYDVMELCAPDEEEEMA